METTPGIILSAQQPAYLPWLGYFHKIALSDIFVVLDNVQFEKNSFINRNRIKMHQGAMWLTVPVLIKGHTQKTILEMEINNSTNWKLKHWKSIYMHYKKAPFFYKYSDFFEQVYRKDWFKLYDLLEYTMNFFIQALKINTPFYRQSNLQIQSKKQLLILDLCKYFKAKSFIFGTLGKNYLDVNTFEEQGIKAVFQDYRHPIYPQLWRDFLSHLSIIDLLFNIGAEHALEIIMNENSAKENLRKMLK